MREPLLRDDRTAGPAPEVWSREEAVERLRVGLLNLSDGEHSMCRIAAERGVFCRGFRRWSDGEFLRRWTKVLGRSTHLTRGQLEPLADLWQLMEQLRLGATLACDAAALCPGACRGWDEFSDADLALFCRELFRRHVAVEAQTAQIDQGRAKDPDCHGTSLDMDPTSGCRVSTANFRSRGGPGGLP
jgi:hypothetical protein